MSRQLFFLYHNLIFLFVLLIMKDFNPKFYQIHPYLYNIHIYYPHKISYFQIGNVNLLYV
jgi:hypothetical protein